MKFKIDGFTTHASSVEKPKLETTVECASPQNSLAQVRQEWRLRQHCSDGCRELKTKFVTGLVGGWVKTVSSTPYNNQEYCRLKLV